MEILELLLWRTMANLQLKAGGSKKLFWIDTCTNSHGSMFYLLQWPASITAQGDISQGGGKKSCGKCKKMQSMLWQLLFPFPFPYLCFSLSLSLALQQMVVLRMGVPQWGQELWKLNGLSSQRLAKQRLKEKATLAFWSSSWSTGHEMAAPQAGLHGWFPWHQLLSLLSNLLSHIWVYIFIYSKCIITFYNGSMNDTAAL